MMHHPAIGGAAGVLTGRPDALEHLYYTTSRAGVSTKNDSATASPLIRLVISSAARNLSENPREISRCARNDKPEYKLTPNCLLNH